jgi:hypothetical protein
MKYIFNLRKSGIWQNNQSIKFLADERMYGLEIPRMAASYVHLSGRNADNARFSNSMG